MAPGISRYPKSRSLFCIDFDARVINSSAEGSLSMAAGLPERPVFVLIVDDEEALRNLLQDALERYGYMVLTARNGVEALAAYAAYPQTIDLLISDIKMPEMSGIELAKRILTTRSGIRILLMSGTTSPPSTRVPFLWKPFRLDKFLVKVNDALNGPAPLPAHFEPLR
jgi:DNA-binding NtrC family response regulator